MTDTSTTIYENTLLVTARDVIARLQLRVQELEAECRRLEQSNHAQQ